MTTQAEHPPSVYRRLVPYLRPHGWRMTGAVFANIGAALLDAFSIALLIPFLNALFNRPPLPTGGGWISHLLHATIGRLVSGGDPMSSKASAGYSIPAAGPATLTATGHGNGYHLAEKRSTESLRYSVERSQLLASGG